MENEVPKYKKKSKKTGIKRADHKHVYAECILTNENGDTIRATYCTICSKIQDRKLLEPVNKRSYTGFGRLTLKCMRERYPKLPVFIVEDLFDAKYIGDISK